MNWLARIVVGLVGLYALIHLVLGSTPVQRRVVNEMKQALSEYGLDLDIESIEFSTFTPRIYLNRVTLRVAQPEKWGLPAEVPIDKIKIQFRPFALLSNQIVFSEILLYHPRFILADCERTYESLRGIIAAQFRMRSKATKYTIILAKAGIVDALFDIGLPQRGYRFRSRSFSVGYSLGSRGQYQVSSDSSHLVIEKGKSGKKPQAELELTKIDLDADIAKDSVRLNRAEIKGDEISLMVRGTSNLPIIPVTALNAQVSYDFSLPMKLLGQVEPLSNLKWAGQVSSEGTLSWTKGVATGKGRAKYKGVKIDDIGVGTGHFKFELSPSQLAVLDLDGEYASAKVAATKLTMGLDGRLPILGDVQLTGMKFDSLLEYLDSPAKPVRATLTGTASANGFARGPFELGVHVKSSLNDLNVVVDDRKGNVPGNLVIRVPTGSIDGELIFDMDRMRFMGQINGLGGTAHTKGYVGFDKTAQVTVEGTQLSLTELGKIGRVELGGRASGQATVEVKNKEASVAATISATGGEIEGIVLGGLKGQLYYRNEMLSFEQLEIPALEPVRGNGWVDFRPEKTAYKFSAQVARAATSQIREVVGKKTWMKWFPSAGEVSGRLLIEGDEDSFSLQTSGEARDATFFAEQWRTALFSLTFKDKVLELNRLNLLKRGGNVEVKGTLSSDKSNLHLQTSGLLLEELDHLKKMPITGRMLGEIVIENSDGIIPVKGNGEIRINNLSYRGKNIGNSLFKIATAPEGIRMDMNLAEDKWVASVTGDKKQQKLSLKLNDFDFLPWLAVGMGRDLLNIGGVFVKGQLELTGQLEDWKTVNGHGVMESARIELSGSPMKNTEIVELDIEEGNVRLKRARFTGEDSRLSLDLAFQPGQKIDGRVDANLDLQYLQPFIPGMDEGRGKVIAGVRFFGPPEKFELLGNVSLQDGVMRVAGVRDEIRAIRSRVTVSQERVQIDQFEGSLNGGSVSASGSIGIDRFQGFKPALKVSVNHGRMRVREYLDLLVSGNFAVDGSQLPYSVHGTCTLHEGVLTRLEFTAADTKSEKPSFTWDLRCQAPSGLQARTEMLNAEFGGDLHLLGNDEKVGLLGTLGVKGGTLVFRDTKFELTGGSVSFDSADKIDAKFNIAGRAVVKSSGSASATPGTGFAVENQYEVTLQALGTSDDYKIRLSSTPSLSEPEIISLLVFGSSNRSQQDSYVALGTALATQLPIQSKIQDTLGVEIKVGAASTNSPTTAGSSSTGTTATDPKLVPNVRLEYGVTKRTKVYLSNTLGNLSDTPDPSANVREVGIQHMLDDNFTINGTAIDRGRSSTATQATPSYGVDLRYRFFFE